ncbi:unnamed protein product [Calypogeia fissa]
MEAVGSWRWSLAAGVCALFLLACQVSADINFESCLKTCEVSGCAGNSCLPSCRQKNATKDAVMGKIPVYQRWKEFICTTECDYHCKLSKETEEAGFEQEAIGYRDNWCLARVMLHQESSKELYRHLAKSALMPEVDLGLINETASAALSALNLLGNLIGLLIFLRVVHYSLPSRPISRGPYYPFAGLWTIYGFLSTVYWVAQCIRHSRNMAFDEHIYVTLEVVLAGYALILAILRVGDMRSEQARVVVFSPTLAFLFPHLMYINLCTFDFGLNTLVCLLIGTIQHLLWITWAVIKKHPAQFQLWLITLFASLTLFFRLYDFSYLWEGLDPDTLWILSAVPLSFLWWSVARSDAVYQTKLILRKRSETIDPKKDQ